MLVEGLLILMGAGVGLGDFILLILAILFFPNLFTVIGYITDIFVWCLIIGAAWSVFRFFFPSKAEKKEWKEEAERKRKAGMFYDGR